MEDVVQTLREFRFRCADGKELPWRGIRAVNVPLMRSQPPDLTLVKTLLAALADADASGLVRGVEHREVTGSDVQQLVQVMQAMLQFSLHSQRTLHAKYTALDQRARAQVTQLNDLNAQVSTLEAAAKATKDALCPAPAPQPGLDVERAALKAEVAQLREKVAQLEADNKVLAGAAGAPARIQMAPIASGDEASPRPSRGEHLDAAGVGANGGSGRNGCGHYARKVRRSREAHDVSQMLTLLGPVQVQQQLLQQQHQHLQSLVMQQSAPQPQAPQPQAPRHLDAQALVAAVTAAMGAQPTPAGNAGSVPQASPTVEVSPETSAHGSSSATPAHLAAGHSQGGLGQAGPPSVRSLDRSQHDASLALATSAAETAAAKAAEAADAVQRVVEEQRTASSALRSDVAQRLDAVATRQEAMAEAQASAQGRTEERLAAVESQSAALGEDVSRRIGALAVTTERQLASAHDGISLVRRYCEAEVGQLHSAVLAAASQPSSTNSTLAPERGKVSPAPGPAPRAVHTPTPLSGNAGHMERDDTATTDDSPQRLAATLPSGGPVPPSPDLTTHSTPSQSPLVEPDAASDTSTAMSGSSLGPSPAELALRRALAAADDRRAEEVAEAVALAQEAPGFPGRMTESCGDMTPDTPASPAAKGGASPAQPEPAAMDKSSAFVEVSAIDHSVSAGQSLEQSAVRPALSMDTTINTSMRRHQSELDKLKMELAALEQEDAAAEAAKSGTQSLNVSVAGP